MAEFQKVMAESRRMCDKFTNEGCKDCPLRELCGRAEEEPEIYEETVMSWAKQNPEPIYPTILELIRYISTYLPATKNWLEVPLNELVKECIPEKVAKELNLVPINTCGLNKYTESEWR